jgi:hypothetical protein
MHNLLLLVTFELVLSTKLSNQTEVKDASTLLGSVRQAVEASRCNWRRKRRLTKQPAPAETCSTSIVVVLPFARLPGISEALGNERKKRRAGAASSVANSVGLVRHPCIQFMQSESYFWGRLCCGKAAVLTHDSSYGDRLHS